MAIIYGIDSGKPLTPLEVCKALVECFKQAHREAQKKEMAEVLEDLDPSSAEKLTDTQIELIVRNAFRATGGDIDSPIKESIVAAMDHLKIFSSRYRDPKIIKRHYNEMMQLVQKL